MSTEDGGNSSRDLDFTRRLNPVRPPVSKKTLIGLGLGMVFMIAPLAIVYLWGISSWRSEDIRLKSEGIDTQAIVVDHRITGGRSLSYLVDVEFPVTAWGESSHRVAIGAPHEQWLRLADGARVPVVYAKSHPDLARLNFGDIYHKGDPHAADRPALLRWLLRTVAFLLAAGAFVLLKTLVLDDEPLRRGKKFGAVD